MKILLLGNTGYLTEGFLKEAFLGHSVFIYGDCLVKSSRQKRVTVFSEYFKESRLEEVFAYHDYEQIIYLSDYLNYGYQSQGEIEFLDSLFDILQDQKLTRLLYVTGPKPMASKPDLKGLTEDFVVKRARDGGVDTKCLYSPYLYSETNTKDFIYGLMLSMSNGTEVTLECSEDSQASFISMTDLADLLSRLLERWEPGFESLVVADPFQHHFGELMESLKAYFPEASVNFLNLGQKEVYANHPEKETLLRKRLGWFMHYSLLKDIPLLYETFKQRNKKKDHFNGILDWLNERSTLKEWQKILEILGSFAFAEIVIRLAQSQSQFQMIDLRLLFVVFISTVFGFKYGILASSLSMIALTVAQVIDGASWQFLFYNTDNWTTFIAYLFIALVCGFVAMRKDDEALLLQKEKQIIAERYDLLDDVYESIAEENHDLKERLLASRDDMGRFYAYFKRLKSNSIAEILQHTIEIAEEILEAEASLFFRKEGYAFLQTRNGAETEIPLSSFPDLEKCLSESSVWANRHLLEGYPSFVFGLKVETVSQAIIWIKNVPFERMGQHRLNELEILADLSQSAIDRALLLNKSNHLGEVDYD